MQLAPVRYDLAVFKGGMDQISPFLGMNPGTPRNALNFECGITGGFTYINGYERYDGQASPSDGVATVITGSGVLSSSVAVGDTITVNDGVTLMLSGDVAAINGTVDVRRITLSKVTVNTGDDMIGVSIYNGATLIGTVIDNAALTSKQYSIDKNDVADLYRADIAAVPGSGPVRGVFLFVDKVYAFRDNEAGDALALYVESVAGWVLVPYMQIVLFAAGTGIPTDGGTLTQGGVTAVAKRVCARSGDPLWVAGDTAGAIVITDLAGGNFAAGAATIGATTLTLAGVQTDIAVAPGGHIETTQFNFYGQGNDRVYGCGGEDVGFEFDGETYVPIPTGAVVDTPKHVISHKSSLFWAVGNGFIVSSPGYPFDYTALNGAFEWNVGGEVSGFNKLPGSENTAALGVWALNSINILYGASADTWDLKMYAVGAGALHYSVQNLAQSIAFDTRGVINLQATLSYGNFDQATLTYAINPFVIGNRSGFICSALNRTTSQYRAFFSNGYGIRTTIINGELIGNTTTLFPDVPFCACDGKLSDGTDVSFFGATDGFVYQLDKGTSFDGDAINAELDFPPNFIKSPRIRKRFRKSSIELYSEHYVSFVFQFSTGYGNEILAKAFQNERTYSEDLFLPQWDVGVWDDGSIWDGYNVTPKELRVTGTGTSIKSKIVVNSDYIESFTVNSLTTNYSYRRGER